MSAAFVVVTGATGTLGRELVAQLSGSGAEVIAVSRSGAELTGTSALRADLGSDDSIEAIRAALGERQVSMAVHAVGLPGGASVEVVDPDLLGDAVNLKAGGFLRLWRAVQANLSPRARMVAVGGHLGTEPSEHSPLAGVANAAVANLVRQLVGPVGRRGATVHLVAPGPFESPRVDALIERAASARGVEASIVREELVAEYPTGRMPRASDVAAIIASLAASHNDALNGATIFADGGIKRSIF